MYLEKIFENVTSVYCKYTYAHKYPYRCQYIYIYIYIYMNGELGDENDIFYLTGFHYNVFLFD